MLTVLDLFSGIGGISLGLESTGGFRTVAFCEIEPFPRAVLRKHWPEVVIHEDVRTLSAATLGGLRPDVICGGFPCQDISVAGKGAGLDGKRSGLWGEYARLVGELRPRWVVAENVGALRTRGVDRVCSDLEGEGYSVWPLLVGAWAVGAPHKRERVWIVARLADSQFGGIRDGGREEAPGAARGVQGQGLQRERFRVDAEPSDETRSGGAVGNAQHNDGRAEEQGREPEGGTAARRSGASVADRHGRGRQGKRYSYRDAKSPIHSQSFWNLADGRGERPVGEPTGSGLEGQRADAGEPGAIQPRSTGEPGGARIVWQSEESPRWPARPGEPQWEWEPSRLAQFQVGCDLDGLPVRLARRANRESLKALGNSVVPQVVAIIGKAILEADEALR